MCIYDDVTDDKRFTLDSKLWNVKNVYISTENYHFYQQMHEKRK